MKTIPTNGISYIELLEGTQAWYWGSDYASGDLYEAEELFQSGHPVKSNRLIFVHYPDGKVIEPIRAREGQYFGRPIFSEGKLHILSVDFAQANICITRYDDETDQAEPIITLPLNRVEDCCNLMLFTLVRQSQGKIQLIWPEKGEYTGQRESLFARDGDKLYGERWYETENDTREEVVVRRYPTGEILQVIPGGCRQMPNGEKWILR